jgi:cell division protein FtsB
MKMKIMLKKVKLPTRQQVGDFLKSLAERGLVLLLLTYMSISVGRSVMKNYQINQRIDRLNEKILELEQEKLYLKNLIAYYKTDTFKELKAREELGFQKPGEKVLSVAVDPDDLPLGGRADFLIAVQPKKEKPVSNYEKWYRYFFGS